MLPAETIIRQQEVSDTQAAETQSWGYWNGWGREGEQNLIAGWPPYRAQVRQIFGDQNRLIDAFEGQETGIALRQNLLQIEMTGVTTT